MIIARRTGHGKRWEDGLGSQLTEGVEMRMTAADVGIRTQVEEGRLDPGLDASKDQGYDPTNTLLYPALCSVPQYNAVTELVQKYCCKNSPLGSVST